MESIWLYLEPYVFISEDRDSFLLYNSRTQKGFSFSKSESVNSLLEKMKNVDYLYSVKISSNDLENDSLYDFVQQILESGCGDLVEGDLDKPIIFPPILSLHRSAEKMELHGIPFDENILSYLHEVIIYLNGECDLKCENCAKEFKQHHCCTKSNDILDISKLEKFLYSVLYTKASITISGGNILKYENLDEILILLKNNDIIHTLIVNWENLLEESKILALLSKSSFRLGILVNGLSYNISSITNLAKKINQYGISQYWEISVSSLSEYEKAEFLYMQLKTWSEVRIVPIYNGKNTTFFEDYIFMDQEDISMIQLSRRDIFIRQSLNINSFGKITVLPNGKIYANMNDKSIGNMGDPLKEILCKEFKSGISWRRTRYSVEPCSSCRFKIICPSISNYELVLERNNLCHIR